MGSTFAAMILHIALPLPREVAKSVANCNKNIIELTRVVVHCMHSITNKCCCEVVDSISCLITDLLK